MAKQVKKKTEPKIDLPDNRQAKIDKAVADLSALQLFDGGTPEQRAEFMGKINTVITELSA